MSSANCVYKQYFIRFGQWIPINIFPMQFSPHRFHLDSYPHGQFSPYSFHHRKSFPLNFITMQFSPYSFHHAVFPMTVFTMTVFTMTIFTMAFSPYNFPLKFFTMKKAWISIINKWTQQKILAWGPLRSSKSKTNWTYHKSEALIRLGYDS